MENGSGSGSMQKQRWRFEAKGDPSTASASPLTVRGVLDMLMEHLNKNDPRPTIPLGHGDPSSFPSFHTAASAVDAIVHSLHSAEYNCYSPTLGILPARRAIADYLNRDLPYKLSPDDVYLTLGCTQAIEVILRALPHHGANILLPRPGYPYYEACAKYGHLEVRHFDLLPEEGWEVDLKGVETLADENTVAIVIINPGNPCGNVFTYQHLQGIAETARKLGIMVIADEVYGHLTFGSTPFVPMGVFASIVPVLTLGSISKRWIVPGWRLGWIVTTDPNGILQNSGIVDSIKSCLSVSSDPATFIQGAVPQILEKTDEDFFSKIIDILRESAGICYDRIKEIPCMICPKKPDGSMSAMVKLNLELLEDINSDMDFSLKLAKEENVLVLPGSRVIITDTAGMIMGMKDWLRITFAIEPSVLEEGLGRIKAFYYRHAKKQ